MNLQDGIKHESTRRLIRGEEFLPGLKKGDAVFGEKFALEEFRPTEAQQFDPVKVAAAHRKLLPQRIAEMPFDVPVVLFPHGDWPWLFVKRPNGEVFAMEIPFAADATNELAEYDRNRVFSDEMIDRMRNPGSSPRAG
jgi:hypothetical protein